MQNVKQEKRTPTTTGGWENKQLKVISRTVKTELENLGLLTSNYQHNKVHFQDKAGQRKKEVMQRTEDSFYDTAITSGPFTLTEH